VDFIIQNSFFFFYYYYCYLFIYLFIYLLYILFININFNLNIYYYRFKKDEREPLIQIVENIYPLTLKIAQNAANTDSLEAAEIIKLIFKIYSASIQVSFHVIYLLNILMNISYIEKIK